MIATFRRHAMPRLALSIVLLALVSACATNPDGQADGAQAATAGTLAGELVYRQRIALTPDAIIKLRLVDSKQDSVIAQQTIRPQGQQVPIAFALKYAPADFVAANPHQLLVTVGDGQGQVLWVANAPVDATSGKLQVRLTQTTQDRAALLGAQWQLQRIEQTDGTIAWARAQQPSTLEFRADGSFGGKAACNSFFGSYQLNAAGALIMGQAGATLMACPDAGVAQPFLQALATVDGYAIANDQLLLFADNAVIVLGQATAQ